MSKYANGLRPGEKTQARIVKALRSELGVETTKENLWPEK
jgi:hypothetical protein